MSTISQTLEIHSLYITSNSASLNGGATLFLTTFTLVLFQVASLSTHVHASILSFLLTSSL
jgi:hypothetical protein